MRRLIGLLAAAIVLLTATLCWADSAAPKVLTSFDFNIVGIGLKPSPEYQAVPKGIASRVDASIDAGSFNAADIIAQLPQDYTVRAELTGPAFQTPLPLVTKPGRPFDLPTLAILGKYTLSNIRLVDGNGNTLFGAIPQAVAIESIADPLITSVTTRPLTLQEIKDRGVTFDASNFTAYQFTASIATESGQVPLNIPLVIPTSAVVNNPPDTAGGSDPVIDLPPVPELPPQVDLPQNLTVAPFLMEVQEKEAVANISLPPIPGVVVIPGNIGFLHQYFSALAIVTNGAPQQSDLVIRDVKAKIVLPTGDVVGQPPLRLASGAAGSFPDTLAVTAAGPDGKNGTPDDVALMHPAESGQADFTIEGLKEGTHKLDFEITATLEGLPIGPVTLKGKATGAVLVRNPDFSITLGHPSTIRSGEKYDLFVTVTNTGSGPANLVSVSLDPRAISGAVFDDGETQEKTIETIPAGSAATVKFRLKSQRTGKVTATAVESSDVRGRFILRAGVGELNIPLSPDSLILPYTGTLPADVLTPAMALLGQAWSVATAPAGALPADVLPIAKATVSARAYDLSEAGLRMALGDSTLKAIEDLAFDLIGSDNADRGFDDLRRRSSQGAELNRALAALFQQEVTASGLFQFQQQFEDKVSYRPKHISVVTSSAAVNVRISDPSGHRAGGLSPAESYRELPYGDQLLLSSDADQKSTLTLVTALATGSYKLELSADAEASFDLGVVVPDAAGVLQQLRFSGLHLSAGGKGTLVLNPNAAGSYLLAIDDNGDGVADSSASPSAVAPIADHAPQIVAATQIVPGVGPGGDKHGRNVAILFSERVAKASAENLGNYAVDQNRVANANLQPGSRMAFLLLRDGIGPFFKRNMTVSGITDNAGNAMPSDTREIAINAKGPAAIVTGAVRTARGEAVPNAKIRLYQLINYDDGFTIEPRYALLSEKSAGTDGSYQFDYVLQNDDPSGPFMLEGVNPETGEVGSITTAVISNHQTLNLDILMKARGSVSGTIRSASGAPVAGATVQITTLNDNRSLATTTDGSGGFTFTGLSVGAFSLYAVHQASLSEGRGMGTLADDGGSVTQDLVIYQVSGVARGNVTGKVLSADGTARSGLIVIIEATNYRNWMRSASDGSFVFTDVFAGPVTVTVRDDATGEISKVTGGVAAGASTALNVIMGGTGTVTGQVGRNDGKPVSGLSVIAAVNLIRRVTQTDANGAFSFTGLSTGNVTLYVVDSADFSRSLATGTVSLLSSGDTANAYLFIDSKTAASGTIQGKVLKRDGTAMARAEVRRLKDAYSYYPAGTTDDGGNYSIPNVPMGTYRIVVMSGNEVANGQATLWHDQQVEPLNLVSAGLGTVTGTTYDDPDKFAPTGANVTLISVKPNEVGWLVYDSRFATTVKSDAATGKFTFPGVYAGTFTVTASNVLRPVPVSAAGTIAFNGDKATVDLSLKGLPPSPDGKPVNQMGSISGQVLKPDGITPVGAGIVVGIDYSGVVSVATDANGKFKFDAVPAGNQQVTAQDTVTTLSWQGYVSVPAGLDVPMTIKLLGRGSMTVKVPNRPLHADGTREAVTVALTGTAYPHKEVSGSIAGDSDSVTFDNLPEGSYGVTATATGGSGLSGRGTFAIPADKAAITAEVSLASSGTVTGKFLMPDGVTPVKEGGQIRLKRNGQVIAYTTSSTDAATLGAFRFEYVPMGDFTVEGFNPVTGRTGVGGGRLTTDGTTVSADTVIIPQGTVTGRVQNYSGTAPVDRASVSISVSGVNSFSYSTITGPDGSFVFAGVPAGQFTVSATDPTNGLRGRITGTVSFEGENAQAEVRIAATGSVLVHVHKPDGSAAANAQVTLGGDSRQTDAAGSFQFDNLAAGSSYTVNASENGTGTLRTGSAIATITNDGDVAVADITLRGLGTVAGVVYENVYNDASGSYTKVPLAKATVTLTVNGASDFRTTLDDGSYSFSPVPAGSFTLKAKPYDRTTGASASGSLQREGETVEVDMTVAQVGSVGGYVVMPDGVTPARGGGVRLDLSSGGSFSGVIESDGRFDFDNIPVPFSFSLYTEDAQGLAIGRYSATVTEQDPVVDVGTIKLDDKPITVAGIDPTPGLVNVPVGQKITVLFSTPCDPATVSSSSLYLLQGTTTVPGTVAVNEDRMGAIFTPSAPLAGFVRYTVVVTTAIKDPLWRTLPQQYTASFTTIDNIAPVAQAVSPPNGALEVASNGVIRVTFSESIDAAFTSGIVLTQGGIPVDATVDLTLGGTVAIITPTSPLAANGTYTVTVSGVHDLVGNVMQGTLVSSFNTTDTVIPTITSLTVPASADLIKGNSVVVTARVADSDVALVDFYVNDVYKTSVKSAPFAMPLTLAATGPLQLKAVAQDKAGNRGVPAVLDLAVAADSPPTVAITAPAEGSSVNTGAPFSVSLQGNDDLGVNSFTVTVSGELGDSKTATVTTAKNTGATVTFTAPSTITSDARLVLTATAKDTAGTVSEAVRRTLTLHDSIAPTISLTSRGSVELYKPTQTAEVVAAASDNVGVVAVSCSAVGAATGSQTFDVAPAAVSTSQTFSFPIPLEAPPHSSINVSCSVSDAAGNAKSAILNLTVADVVPPIVTSTLPADGAANIPATAQVTVGFSEPVSAATVTAGTITLAESASGTAVPGAVTISADRRSAVIKPSAPLKAATAYTVVVSTGLADDADNHLASVYQASFTTDATAPEVVSVTPTADSSAVPPGVVITVRFNEPIDPASVAADAIALATSELSIPGNVAVSADKLSISFTPLNQLGLSRSYTMTLKAGVRDVSGNAMAADLTSSFTTQGPDSDLVGYWPMDGDWNDYSGKGNNGAPINGPQFSTDHMDGSQAGSFHGGGDYVSVGNLYGNFPNNTFSIESWVKLDDTGSGARRTFAGGAGSGADYAIGLIDNQFTAYTYRSSGYYAKSGFTPETGKWYHVAGTFDGSRIRLYVNGELMGEVAGAWGQSNGGANFWIGQESCCGNNFNGLLDEVSLYKRALAPEDILEHYNAGLTGDRTSPNQPTVQRTPAATYVNQVVLRGTKDPGASIRINEKQVVDHDPTTTWQVLYPLAVGENLLDITSRDESGNASVAVPVAINLVPGAPGLTAPTVAITSPGESARYNPGDSGTSTVTASSADGITALYCNASGGVSEGSAVIPFDPPQTEATQEFAFTVAPDNGPSEPIQVFCIAETTTGALAGATLDLFSSDRVAPQVSITSPADGSTVNTGSSFTVVVQGGDETEVKSVTLTVDGEFDYAETKAVTSGKSFSTSFTITAPTVIRGDGSVVVTVAAADEVGNASLSATRTFILRDSIKPVVTLSSQGETTKYRPGLDTAVVNVTMADNMGVSHMDCYAYGAVTASQSFDRAPEPNETAVFSFAVPGSALPYATITATCTAYDAMRNSASASINLIVADVVSPTVSGSSPADGATDVPTGAPLTVSFSEAVAASSVNAASFALTQSDSGTVVPATVTLSGDRKSVTVKPVENLTRGVGYTLTVGTAVADDAGNPLAAPYLVWFTSDNAAPTVASVTPEDGSTNVQIASAVSVRFSEPIDPVSVTADLISLTSVSGPVPGNLSVSSDGLTVNFKPYNALGYNRAYTFKLKAGVRDVSGNAVTEEKTATFTTQSPDADLVGYWTMDGDWSDYSGKGNNGTAYGSASFSATHLAGTQAGSFNGTTSYASMGSGSSLVMWAETTVSAWIYPTGAGSDSYNGGFIVSKGGEYEVARAADGTIYYAVMSQSPGFTFVRTGFVAPLNTWTHLVWTYSSSAGQINLYANGKLVYTGNCRGTISDLNTSANDLLIGKRYDGVYFKGMIDEVSVRKRALLQEDVTELYNFGLSTDRTPPMEPTVDGIPESTYNTSIVLRGTKEAGSSIRVNGKEVVAHDDNATWQLLYRLNLGQNLLEVTSHDLAGNVSTPVNRVVNVLPSIDNNADVIGAWRMDGDWSDSSGSGNHGTAYNGSTFVSGHVSGSKAGSFDGVNDYVLTQKRYLTSTAPNTFTISFWAYPTATRNATSEDTGGTSGVSGQRYAIAPWYVQGTVGSGVSVGTNGISVFEVKDNYMPSLLVYPGQLTGWNHIVVIYENGRPRLYLNGNLVRTGLQSYQTNIYPPAQWGDAFGYGPYRGSLDNVLVYKRMLSNQEVSDLYSSQSSSPVVSLSSPGASTLYHPGDSGTATVTASSPGGITKLSCNVSGAVSEGTLVLPFDTPQTSVTRDITFRVSANAAPYAPYRVSCVAETAAAAPGSANLDLKAADVVPPGVASSSIANNATGVIATAPISVTFNEEMLPSSFNSSTVNVVRQDTGAFAVGTISVSTNGKTVTFTPTVALEGSAPYSLILQGVSDLSGNRLDYQLNFTTQVPAPLNLTDRGTSSAPVVVTTGRYSTISLSSSYVVFDGVVAADAISLSNNSTLSHYTATKTTQPRLEIQTSALTIDATSKIDVSGRGYLGGGAGDNNTSTGLTYGNLAGSSVSAGGSYGGMAGAFSGSTANAAYGVPANPNELGSGGGSNGGSGAAGGNGGGLVRIVADTLTLDGKIMADGGTGQWSGYSQVGGSGGSGGGIRIDAGTILGSGYMYARGGSAAAPTVRAVGGGGRIAVYYGSSTLPKANLVATGAVGSPSNGGPNGAAGTVYLSSTSNGGAELVVDNRGNDTAEGSTPLPSLGSGTVTDLTATSLTTTGTNWKPGALKGMKFNPDVAQNALFTVVDNDATTLRIDGSEGNLTQVAAPGSVFAGTYGLDTLTVSGKARVSTFDRIAASGEVLVDGSTLTASYVKGDRVTARNGALVTHNRATASAEYGLEVTAASSVSIDSTSRIDVSGRGYLGGYSGDNTAGTGRTNGNKAGSSSLAGGSYGGIGGALSGATANPVYGDLTNPNEPGSGGGSDGYTSGNGGGLVRIVTGNLTLDGTIVADGGAGAYSSYSGTGGSGGSGGGIMIDADTVSGAGTIYARGGSANSRGGGGGGRIAVHYGSMSLSQANISAVGRSSSANGGAGTIFLKDKSRVNGDVIVNNGGLSGTTSVITSLSTSNLGNVQIGGSTLLTVNGSLTADSLALSGASLNVTGGVTAGNLTLENGTATVAGPAQVSGMLWLKNNGVLTVPWSTATAYSKLEIQAGSVTIDGTSRIDVSAKGYLGGYAGDNTGATGRTNGNVAGSSLGGGGSYGGLGGVKNNETSNGVYGVPANPNEPGSGGGSNGGSSYPGGNGGGLLRMAVAGTLALDGKIIADGGTGAWSSYSGSGGSGGSGGGIRIDAASVTGGGYIYSRGGSAVSSDRGVGGGGRIALYYGSMTLPKVNVVATGATGSPNAGAGTVYLKNTVNGTDEVVVDNRGADTAEGSTPLPSLGSGVVADITPTSITATGTKWKPGALKGMKFNPDVTQNALFTVVDNDATTLRTDGSEGDLTTVAARGSVFAGTYGFTGLTVLGKGRVSTIDRIAAGGEIVVDGSTLTATYIGADKVTAQNGGVITHFRTTAAAAYRLEVSAATSVTIDSTSKIDLSGRGYLGGYSGDNAASTGRANQNVAGSSSQAGGSYGGVGGNYGGSTSNVVYGDFANPNELGSGGGSDFSNSSYAGGNGGGLLRMTTQSLTVYGSILADGGAGAWSTYNGLGGSGGSGGGILINAGTVAGTGTIAACGGAATSRSGGGGGRIAIYYGNLTLPQGNILASGGVSGSNGGGGSIYLKNGANANGDLLIANTASAANPTPLAGSSLATSVTVKDTQVTLPAGLTLAGDLTVDNGSVVATALQINGSLRLNNKSTLSHPVATLTGISKLDITAGNVTVDATSRIDVSAKGYLGGYAGGNGSSGRSDGNVAGSSSTGGGSYGGLAGAIGSGTVNGVYGDITNPNEPGSGGGSDLNTNYTGGNGGGLLRITTPGTVTVDGSIVADGGAGAWSTYYGQGGSGGSGGGIRIDAASLSGSGYIYARGGTGTGRGGGSGGRIALHYGSSTLPPANVVASGGTGSANGAAGTAYRRMTSNQTDQLVLDNRGIDTADGSLALPALGTGTITGVNANSITVSGANWKAGAWKGRKFNPNLNQSRLFTVVDNSASTLYVDGSEGDLVQFTAPGSTFAGTYNFTSMVIAGKARVATMDRIVIDREIVVEGSTLITGNLAADRVTLSNGALLSHDRTTTSATYQLEVTGSSSLTIDASSKIDVSGRGYLGGYSGSNTSGSGRTRLNVTGSNSLAGGSYGGLGGTISSGIANSLYGDAADPNDLGSGGGSDLNSSYPGGNGGGLLRIVAGTLTVNGNILADGGAAGWSSYYGRGGSGGSGGGIRISAATLSGTGYVCARGGTGTGRGGGGGGRIAIYADNLLLPQGNIMVGGGAGSGNGAAGSLYLH